MTAVRTGVRALWLGSYGWTQSAPARVRYFRPTLHMQSQTCVRTTLAANFRGDETTSARSLQLLHCGRLQRNTMLAQGHVPNSHAQPCMHTRNRTAKHKHTKHTQSCRSTH